MVYGRGGRNRLEGEGLGIGRLVEALATRLYKDKSRPDQYHPETEQSNRFEAEEELALSLVPS